ncbi:methyl-accepting chemotaxis protein [Pullulanibacillus sp. KACC 23026]|uniref:methyl-accepting chemotaxis protein n=1 Tax=Pullulanibacillus sp. KACC 23026 TaxID=3028315 RepID=UPI0023B18207|nr:methyl-accepting chemotaxis protein [Pullulanibacillus sp. KACC 23026]WEG12466.1 methyl-accepting chemotaxis protein [Pullulanibacillus sp. KACC 23026]
MAKKQKKNVSNTLLKQFTTRMLVVLLVILGVSGIVQYYYLNSIIDSNVRVESSKVSASIEQGIKETDTASRSIENQIDLKLKLVAQRISDRLGNQSVNTITNSELAQISKDFGIGGITIFVQKGDDIVGVSSTTPSDIGFSFKKFLGADNHSLQSLIDLLHGKPVIRDEESYVDSNTTILPIAPSGSNKSNTPIFYKYGYYHANGSTYIINPFIKANEVYQFTQSVGPNSWIKTVLRTNKDAKEVAVLDPKVYADPSLLKNKYNMLKKVEYGEFNSETKKDSSVIASMVKHPQKVSYIEKQNGFSYYKMFIPMKDGKVIYVALDYNRMSAPLKNMSWILLVFSLLSLLALFVLATRFFNSIYKNIQAIMTQIKQLEVGDFTARSIVTDTGELADLSASTNHMTETLNEVLKDTTKHAEKVQSLALALKSDTDNSVEKVYSLSIDLTSRAREDNFEVSNFLDMLEEKTKLIEAKSDREEIMNRIMTIKELSNNRTESTTDITLTLSDLIQSLHNQSIELSDISGSLFNNMYQFKLK